MTSQKNGPTMTTEPRMRTACTPRWLRRRRFRPLARGRRVASSDIVHPLLLEPELQGGHRDDDDEDDEGDRGGIPLLVLDEAPLVELRHDRLGLRVGRVRRPGHDEDEVERLERADDGEHRDEEDARADLRERDRPELPDAARAVERGRLVEVLWHALDRGEEDDDLRAQAEPDAH